MAEFSLPHHHGESWNEAALKERLADPASFESVSRVLRLLDDTSRVRIFWLLCHCEECVINISALVDMSAPAVSHHLRQLKSGGLIVSRREGKEVYYRTSDTPAARLLHQVIELIMEIACPR